MTKELRTRWIYALLAATVVGFVLLFLNPIFIFLFALICGLIGWREFARLTTIKDKSSFYLAGFAWVLSAFTLSFFQGPNSYFWFYLSLFGSFSVLALERLLGVWGWVKPTDETPERAWFLIQRFVLGTLYIFLLFGFVGPIAMKPHGQQLLFMGITSVAFGDAAAYFGGKRFGKQKLWPQLSPGKTVQGAYFSLLGTILGALVVWGAWKLSPATRQMPISSTLLLGFLASPLGMLGDLLESMIKRDSGMKDSGTLLPGHGGLLDRTDALVFVFPIIYFLF
ncbi:phosphatidate cytidylyltransferase [bacterium]|nr:phosphatidate cytidylyltransferase [bacterium]